MIKKWGADREHVKTDDHEKDSLQDISNNIRNLTADENTGNRQVNTILKGSKITGDIKVECDLEVIGDVEGNITAQEDSNIVIKGSCTGNIETGRGNVDIRGELRNGNITTGGNVSISGKFTGGEVKAKGRIYVDCEFKGKLEGSEIEIGSNAHGKGELCYKEYISVARGAKIEVHLCRIQEEGKAENKFPENKIVEMKHPVNELMGIK